MILQAVINVVVVAGFMTASILTNAKASRRQAKAKAFGLTTHGPDIEAARQWLFVSVVAVLMAGTMVFFGWKAIIDTFDPPLWLKAGQLAVSATIVIGGLQFMLWRRRSIMNPQP